MEKVWLPEQVFFCLTYLQFIVEGGQVQAVLGFGVLVVVVSDCTSYPFRSGMTNLQLLHSCRFFCLCFFTLSITHADGHLRKLLKENPIHTDGSFKGVGKFYFSF